MHTLTVLADEPIATLHALHLAVLADEPVATLHALHLAVLADKPFCITGTAPCKCSGSGDGDLYKVEIVDKLRLPSDLPAGDWVLGWRWFVEIL